uniref:Uncharacterized protein n=1 Tax=Setaria italica TaxID=4555 RepID=K3YFI2_SETIT
MISTLFEGTFGSLVMNIRVGDQFCGELVPFVLAIMNVEF